MMSAKREATPKALRQDHPLNGGESCYVPPEPQPHARATSCLLSEIVDEAIELLTLIDQPEYWKETENV